MQAGLPGPAAASSQQNHSLSHCSQSLPARHYAGKHVGGCRQQELTTYLTQTPLHTHQSHALCPSVTAVPSGSTCWQSAQSGSGCQHAATSGRRLVWKRCTLVTKAWQSTLKSYGLERLPWSHLS